MGDGFRGANGQPASPPYTHGPYNFSEFINFTGGVGGALDVTPSVVRFVDNSAASGGDGTSWDSAYKYVQDAITEINTSYSGKGAIIYVAPGLYAEATPINITASDVRIIAIGAPEDTVIFGVTTQGTVAASDDHLFNITGGNIQMYGLALFTYKNDKAAVYLNGEGGGYAGGFCRFVNCIFSPQAVDGQGYGIYMSAGAGNEVIGCKFYGTKTAGIYIASSASNNPTRLTIANNQFIGCGDAGIKVAASALHEAVIDRNIFNAGSESNYNQTDDIVFTADCDAGSCTICDNYASTTTFGDFVADAGDIAPLVFNNHYTADS